jgi:Plasmid pRiA4b ORF-3-like protein
LRVEEEAELRDLAKLARDCAVMTQAVALARWISDTGPRRVTPSEVLTKPDLPAAAEAVGVSLPARLPQATQIPALHEPWCLALATGLLEVDGRTVNAGPELAVWPSSDADALSAWLAGLRISCTAGAGTGPYPSDNAVADELALLGVLQTQDQQVPAGQALAQALQAEALKLSDEFGLDPVFARTVNESFLMKKAERLASFGAISGADVLAGGCSITPLGRWAAEQLRPGLAGPEEDLTAAELIEDLAECAESERDDEAWAWFASQPDPVDAARQLLQAGASMEPRLRWIAADAAELLGEEALPAWREMVEVPGIGPHARYALYQLGAGDEPNDRDWLWLAVESAAVGLAEKGPDRAVSVLWDVFGVDLLAADDLDSRLDLVRSSDHPSAQSLAQEIADHVASAGLASLSVYQCLQLKVTLKRWNPPIWRTVLLPATASLATLHRVIQVLYGWDGDHQHQFLVRDAIYSDPSFGLEETGNEYRRHAKDALGQVGGKIVYEYDFGAGWTHEVVLQKQLQRDPSAVYPVCTKFSGDSPVEYPDEEDYSEPGPFDLAAVNRRLAALGDLGSRPVAEDAFDAELGVDRNDSDAANRWLEEHYDRLLYSAEVDPTTWDGVDLKTAFDLPPVLAPIRLPDDAELAEQARIAPLIVTLRDLADQVRDATVRTADVDPLVLSLALDAELVDTDGDRLIPGEDVAWLDGPVGDHNALLAWDYMFASILDSTLEAADETEPRVAEELDLDGHGLTLATMLFLRREGIGVVDLASELKQDAVAELPTGIAAEQWRDWVDAHGDPCQLLLGQLEKLGAVTVTVANEDDKAPVARLTPLGLRSVRKKLEGCGVEVPFLPPANEVTAENLVDVRMLGTEQDFEAEFASWAAERTPNDAARELLTLAANGTPILRLAAVPLASRLGPAAEPAWREALDRMELRCYAKPTLAKFAGLNPGSELPAELAPATEDVAWLIADSFGPLTQFDVGIEALPVQMTELQDRLRATDQEAIFEAMARLKHPDAEAVLTIIGKYATDKRTAKAARRAAYKAASRRAARDRP